MRKFWKILTLLVIIRTFLLVLLITQDFPPTPFHNGWIFHHGGDQGIFFELAKSLVEFNPIRAGKTLGFPLMLTPFILIFKASSPYDILVPVVILHAFIMFNLSIILVALIAEKLTKNKLISLSSAALWTLFPYLFLLFIDRVQFVHLMCVQELSDPPSLFFVVLSTYLFLLSREREGVTYPVLTGLTISLATLTRPPNVFLFALFFLVFIYEKRFKKAIYIAVAAFLVSVPQLVYDYSFFGSPLKFGHIDWYERSGGIMYNEPIISTKYFLPIMIKAFLYTPTLCFSALLGFILLYFYSNRKKEAVFLLAWYLPHQIFYSFFQTAQWTLYWVTMPAIPALCILASSALLIVDEEKVHFFVKKIKALYYSYLHSKL